ncbi:MAG: hypothetical protein ACHQJ6_03670 [Candidatus Berkiellales bacterium]
MTKVQFYFAFILLGIVIFALMTTLWMLCHHHPEISLLFFIQSIYSLACYLLLGIGLGVPLILLATILGWVQLILLLSGNINPHLAREGFLKVLNTLFSKL